jgi:DNA-binding Lrp family transcriptional regulator
MSDQLRQLLTILERDGNTTPEKAAIMLGISESEVNGLLSEARDRGILLKTKAVVNWQRAGDTTVTALIEVRVVPQRGVGFDSVAERIYRFPEVRSLYLVSGTYDLLVMVSAPTMQAVASFVSEKLASLDHVSGTVTHFMLKRYKEEGEILDGTQDVERLAVSP